MRFVVFSNEDIQKIIVDLCSKGIAKLLLSSIDSCTEIHVIGIQGFKFTLFKDLRSRKYSSYKTKLLYDKKYIVRLDNADNLEFLKVLFKSEEIYSLNKGG